MAQSLAQALRTLARACEGVAEAVERGDLVARARERQTNGADTEPKRSRRPPVIPIEALADQGDDDDDDAAEDLTDLETRFLKVLAQANQPQTVAQAGIKGGFSHKSGTFARMLARFRDLGYVEGTRAALSITEVGAEALGSVPRLPEGEELFEFWCGRMGEHCSKILRALRDRHRKQLGAATRQEIGEAANISHQSGTFARSLAKLRRAVMIEGSGSFQLSTELREAVDIRIKVHDRESGRTVKVDRTGVARS